MNRRNGLSAQLWIGAAVLLPTALVAPAGCRSSPSVLEEPTRSDIAREQRARAEFASLDGHGWAGEYTSGADTVGMFVLLSPSEGVIEGGWSCLRPRSVRYLGGVGDVSDDSLRIAANDQSDPILKRLGGCLVRFQWGERRYVAWPHQLRAAEEMLDEGVELSHGSALIMVHVADMEKPPGTPEELAGIVRTLCGNASTWMVSEHGPS